MSYNPPANNAINFALQAYLTPANNAISFELAATVANDALTASSLDTGSFSLGTPVITETFPTALVANSLDAGAFSLGTATLSQVHVLLSTGLSCEAVMLETPILTSNVLGDNLEASSLDTGSATSGTPTLAQIQAFLVINLTSGVPVFATPSIDAELYVIHRGRIMKTQNFEVDRERVTGAWRTITSDHANIHAHEGYELSFGIESVADDGTLVVEVFTGADRVTHMKMVEAWTEGGLAKFEIIEAPTTTGGLEATAVNKSRIDAGVYLSEDTLHTGVTPSGGTSLRSQFFGSGGSGQGSGGSVNMDNEWVLAPSTKYVFRVTNLAGAAKAANLYLFWYEETGA